MMVVLCALPLAQGQQPFVPPEFYDDRRRLGGESLEFCIWSESLTAEFDRDVARELAAVLLLEPNIVEIEPTAGLDEEGEFWENVFIALAESCDAFIGTELVPEMPLPDWLTTTRPYFVAPYVLAVTSSEYARLADVPSGSFIGSRLRSRADLRFLAYQQSLPAGQRWRRIPFDTPERQIEYLLDDSIEGAIMWAPTLARLMKGTPQEHDVRGIPLDPLPSVERSIGLLLHRRNSLLRTMLDDAIVALAEEGAIEELLTEHGLPGEPGRTN